MRLKFSKAKVLAYSAGKPSLASQGLLRQLFKPLYLANLSRAGMSVGVSICSPPHTPFSHHSLTLFEHIRVIQADIAISSSGQQTAAYLTRHFSNSAALMTDTQCMADMHFDKLCLHVLSNTPAMQQMIEGQS